MPSHNTSKSSAWVPLLGIVLLAAFPVFSQYLGLDYYTGFVMRLLISMIIVTSLNFLLGYGGMVALGHAGFIGVGSYAMVALIEAGITSVWLLWFGATVITAIWAALIGLIVLRTRGIYFLMITLAFAEMVYYIAVSLRQYGGDDGYILSTPLSFGLGFDPMDTNTLYAVVLVMFVLTFAFFNRMVDSRFGKAIMGIRDNPVRMQALGYPTFKLQLQAFVIGSAVAGLGGAMMMTQNGFISPTTIHWTHSAELMVIVALGGMGYKWGAILGAGLWGILKEFLPQFTEYWHWPMGLLVILIILYAPNGLWALFSREQGHQNGGLFKFIRRQA
ncbi:MULTISPECIES: branched-chain amino acid ABC transporter permease [unclassified Pusillimonas]|uniref:branched-chain amino acid ABC transporter permease n=1 Tax=unclassified Pusillimonas TaxID=2640016 RepID=UPI000B9CB7F6|nr:MULTISPECIES: branched-chain amino acid ABC transporter permease [unclassified Pusillimonas]OXR50121.1 branched-chain amino acid ABC transporter permease [Pusillimonas sp. T2]ROT46497.1 branched-chain amino acid ABC transporter permease [Pusillimonas sp. NJUB218]